MWGDLAESRGYNQSALTTCATESQNSLVNETPKLSPEPSLLPVYITPHHAGHAPSHEFMHGHLVPYFEMPGRIDSLRDGLISAGFARFIEPALDMPVSALAAVHDDGWLSAFEALSLNVKQIVRDSLAIYHLEHTINPDPYYFESLFPKRFYGTEQRHKTYIYDSVSPIGQKTWHAALHSANLAYAGAWSLLNGEKQAYTLCRPPGHHAGRDFAGGYCYLNNAAVAAAELKKLGRVMVLDVDYHHGNGTQDIFWDDAQVGIVSLHAMPEQDYPYYAGFADEVGAHQQIHNIPLPHGTTEEQYLTALTGALERVNDFQPAAVVVSLGFDTYRDDPIGFFGIDRGGYQTMGARIAALNLPTLYVQEGGYRAEELGALAQAFFTGVLNRL
jgi:acetoin utilization deacetylase AcuC-like enzyme